MISKAMYGAGYLSEVVSIRARSLKNAVMCSEILNKQKQYINEGSKAAQVSFLANRIMNCTYGDISDLRASVNEVKEKFAYLNFSEDTFREATRKVIEEYSQTEEVLMDNHAPELG